MKGLDSVSKQVLEALMADPRADADAIGARLGIAPDVVRSRMDRMHEGGYLRGFAVRLDPERLGMPHEVLVTAVPTDQTTRERLEALRDEPGVTRVWTLASRTSVAFTLRGQDIDGVQERARALATATGLSEPAVTLIVDTLYDDAGAGVHRAWRATP